ncbi:hypothetical protein F5Y13DRAFT_129937 [Hypoxylon sp. FL1857]|nr:hypothetical protein F5Y13DRAFT_129937 [Hypoxylon sp. FL1857]
MLDYFVAAVQLALVQSFPQWLGRYLSRYSSTPTPFLLGCVLARFIAFTDMSCPGRRQRNSSHPIACRKCTLSYSSLPRFEPPVSVTQTCDPTFLTRLFR